MLMELTNMTGEELLLRRVLGGAGVQGAIEQELDCRALLGSREERRKPQFRTWSTRIPGRSHQLVA